MTFEEYLKDKKIDSKAFYETEPDLWNELKNLFDQVHPKSFTMQKLYLINPIRRRYQLKEDTTAQKTEAKPRPQIKMAPRKKPD